VLKQVAVNSPGFMPADINASINTSVIIFSYCLEFILIPFNILQQYENKVNKKPTEVGFCFDKSN